MTRLLVLALLAGCADLPDLGVCGNGVIEAANGEACDDGRDTETCNASCELKCPTSQVDDYVMVRAEDEEDLYCPDETYACGLDRVCRQPSGALEDPSAALSFDVRQVPLVGDFDGDSYDDLIGASATSIFVRFGSPGTQLLSSLQTQEAPSSTSALVLFDVEDAALASSVSIAAPTEGVALLRSDTEQFAPQLDFVDMNFPTDRIAAVVRDPDPALGDVVITVKQTSATSDIAVARQPLKVGAFPGVAAANLPACSGTAGGAWRAVDVEVADDRRSFVVVTAKETAPPAWHLCRYTPNGTAWTLSSSIEFATPPPVTVTLANLDADACDELIGHSTVAVNYARVDATGVDCAFVPGIATIADDVAGDALPIIGSGQIIPGGADELVTTQGVLECANATDCTAGLERRIEPTTAQAWTDAAITDLNGDGAADVVTARVGQDDIDVVRGGSTLNVYRSDTASAVIGTLAGDFDGDRLGDVALVESTQLSGDRMVVVFGTRDGILGAPRAMTDYGGKLKLHRLSAYHWVPTDRGADGIDDVLVVQTSGNGAVAGLSIGDATRLMTTPRFPPTVNSTRDLGAVVAGRFGSEDVELLTISDSSAASLNTTVQLYNVRGNTWATALTLPVDLRAPLGALRGAAMQGFAVGVTGSDAAPNLVTFSGRSPTPACTSTTVSAAPREMRGADLDRDGVDELVVYTGEGRARAVQVFDASKCPATRLAETALADCVDVANVGTKLFALCRLAAMGQARLVFEVIRDNATFRRADEPTARLDGDGRFLSVGDFDGDGVLDLAVVLAIGFEVNIQTLRQCPAHDTRRCAGS